MDVVDFKSHPLRAELLALYAEVDALLAPYTCALSGDCCDFAKTGREPYPTPLELAELERAMRAASIALGQRAKSAKSARSTKSAKKRLPVAGARVCPLLGADGRCRVYAARPFGCRTYFCERVALAGTPTDVASRKLGLELPRKELQRLARRVADLAVRFSPADPGPRPLTRALKCDTSRG